MGKIRVKTLGDEEAEKKQKQDTQKRKEAKKVAAKNSENPEDTQLPAVGSTVKEVLEKVEEKSEEKKLKPAKKEKFIKQKRSTKYSAVAEKVDKSKIYSLTDAVALLPKLTIASFDETVELHINTTDKGISGSMTLPHGTGKQTKVAIASEALIKDIEGGQIDFDILLAEPAMMPKLAKVARILGPRGLMPNPKNGTVTANPTEAAKKYEGGQTNYKTEAKFPILHLRVGKVSFGDKKLAENIKSAITTVQLKNIKNVTLKSTMSPGIRLDATSL